MRLVQELPGLDGERSITRIGGADLCELLRLSPAALSGLVKRGIAVKMGRDAYDLRETVGNYAEHLRGIASGRGGEAETLTLTGERARLARAQAEAVEMKNAVARGELVPAEEVARGWSDTLRRVRSRILAVPSRVRQAVELEPEAVTLIDRELREALTELGQAADQEEATADAD
ncbi:DNA packaging protein [Rhodosalinus sp. K401]|uniref:DNA packaging protein n=1 Tax=Rhodosalinus sp. K401 TaxID=3239195 RepID=UPI0035246042